MPALVGGAVAGVLSGLPLVNCLCCLWIIGGAMLAAFLLSKDSPVVLTAGDGAIVGVFAGIVASVVDLIISIPFQAMSREFFRNIMERLSQYTEEMPSGWQKLLERGTFEASFAMTLLGFVVTVFIFSALGALGGILGISLFRKKSQPADKGVDVDAAKNSSDRQP